MPRRHLLHRDRRVVVFRVPKCRARALLKSSRDRSLAVRCRHLLLPVHRLRRRVHQRPAGAVRARAQRRDGICAVPRGAFLQRDPHDGAAAVRAGHVDGRAGRARLSRRRARLLRRRAAAAQPAALSDRAHLSQEPHRRPSRVRAGFFRSARRHVRVRLLPRGRHLRDARGQRKLQSVPARRLQPGRGGRLYPVPGRHLLRRGGPLPLLLRLCAGHLRRRRGQHRVPRRRARPLHHRGARSTIAVPARHLREHVAYRRRMSALPGWSRMHCCCWHGATG